MQRARSVVQCSIEGIEIKIRQARLETPNRLLKLTHKSVRIAGQLIEFHFGDGVVGVIEERLEFCVAAPQFRQEGVGIGAQALQVDPLDAAQQVANRFEIVFSQMIQGGHINPIKLVQPLAHGNEQIPYQTRGRRNIGMLGRPWNLQRRVLSRVQILKRYNAGAGDAQRLGTSAQTMFNRRLEPLDALLALRQMETSSFISKTTTT